jgi:ABC-2 type transport system permease protein
MRVREMLRFDLRDAVLSYHLHAVVVIFGVIGAFMGYVSGSEPELGPLFLLTFLGPLVAIAFTQHTIAGRRESHELSVLLGLPFSRKDVVLGTFLGRSALLGVAVVVTYITTGIVAVVRRTSIDPVVFFGGLILSATICLIFVGIALGVSSAVRSSTAASIGGFVAYLLFTFQLWSILPDAILYLVNGFGSPDSRPTWALVFEQLSPYAGLRNFSMVISERLADAIPLAARSVPEDPPLYMEPWFAAVVIIVWLVVPALVGYLQFERTDL